MAINDNDSQPWHALSIIEIFLFRFPTFIIDKKFFFEFKLNNPLIYYLFIAYLSPSSASVIRDFCS